MGQVLVVGGANVDVVAQSTGRFTPGTSNPGRTYSSAGGVGRNIAANLGRLGVPTTLITAFGDDTFGRRLRDETAAAAVDLTHAVELPMPSGSYLAMLDADGELVGAVSDMAAAESLRAEHVPEDVVAAAAYVVLDANLSAELLEHVCRAAAAHGVAVVIDPVSVPKADRVLKALHAGPVHTITPTRTELVALTGEDDLDKGVAALRDLGVGRVWVREGASGSTLFAPGSSTHVAAIPADVRNVTGAGDAMAAAYVHALVTGHDDVTAARHGAAAAYLTITSEHTVRPDLTPALIGNVLKEPHS
ncbi:MAG TPA: carbohydrate kinase family protein [Flexivirga sp.]|uniref:carbohydrate kinase family protein n=1 Tax=Flexivirga sp. TaxID=1962927 RepID=UPI002C96F324|nr:carbohydrate kinase family protein [Flexivirga sp.]HWC24864.1 carbohydrate kinase family protein [Flexivirga sp.]